jgi:hypothetical protein
MSVCTHEEVIESVKENIQNFMIYLDTTKEFDIFDLHIRKKILHNIITKSMLIINENSITLQPIKNSQVVINLKTKELISDGWTMTGTMIEMDNLNFHIHSDYLESYTEMTKLFDPHKSILNIKTLDNLAGKVILKMVDFEALFIVSKIKSVSVIYDYGTIELSEKTLLGIKNYAMNNSIIISIISDETLVYRDIKKLNDNKLKTIKSLNNTEIILISKSNDEFFYDSKLIIDCSVKSLNL